MNYTAKNKGTAKAFIKQYFREKTGKQRVHNMTITPSSATCGCGETKSLIGSLKGDYVNVAICKNCKNI